MRCIYSVSNSLSNTLMLIATYCCSTMFAQLNGAVLQRVSCSVQIAIGLMSKKDCYTRPCGVVCEKSYVGMTLSWVRRIEKIGCGKVWVIDGSFCEQRAPDGVQNCLQRFKRPRIDYLCLTFILRWN